MKKLIAVILTFCLTFAVSLCITNIIDDSLSVSTFLKNVKANLVIDAGHGGINAGTIDTDGAKEKTINLSIAQKLYDFARAAGLGATLVRDGDYLVYAEGDDKSRSDLYNRMDYINSVDKAVLISIHQRKFQ